MIGNFRVKVRWYVGPDSYCRTKTEAVNLVAARYAMNRIISAHAPALMDCPDLRKLATKIDKEAYSPDALMRDPNTK
jgi:hypothetical protein